MLSRKQVYGKSYDGQNFNIVDKIKLFYMNLHQKSYFIKCKIFPASNKHKCLPHSDLSSNH